MRKALWIFAYASIWVVMLSGIATANEPAGVLKKANYYADLYNWLEAGPLYAQAEKPFAEVGDKGNELYARFGRIRGTMETLNLPQTSDELAIALEDPLVQGDLKLKLFGLVVKGDIDHEIDPCRSSLHRSRARQWTRFRNSKSAQTLTPQKMAGARVR
ncbi:MAG: hypothetical protein L0220_01805 [Acidobacteria bacterium]|nr:hypothetical protein [Acidobacteriota bacterium]